MIPRVLPFTLLLLILDSKIASVCGTRCHQCISVGRRPVLLHFRWLVLSLVLDDLSINESQEVWLIWLSSQLDILSAYP